MEELLEKLEKELEDYKLSVKEKGVDFAIDRAYEITIKQEIINSIKYDQELFDIEIKRLLTREDLLDEMYDDWTGANSNIRDNISCSVEETIEIINSKFEKEKDEER